MPSSTYANLRRKKHTLTSGNLFKDAVDNTVYVLNDAQRTSDDPDPDSKFTYIRKVTGILDHEPFKIERTPLIAVAFDRFEEEPMTLGMTRITHNLQIYLNIFYYHKELSVNIRKQEIVDALWEIARILRRNSDVNGLSSEGATIGAGRPLNRMRNGVPYAGGQLMMKIPILHRSRRARTS